MQKILIIGCGLIGSSLAKAIKDRSKEVNISIFDNDKKVIDSALSLNIADSYYDFSHKTEFDLTIISSPLSSYKDIFELISENISKSLIIDLGSLNYHPISICPDTLKSSFISCHPIAGSEKSGIENSNVNLFRGKNFIISDPDSNLKAKNKEIIGCLTKIIGSNIITLDAKEHDKAFALVSHLPQFLSFLSLDMSPNIQEDGPLSTPFRLNNSNPAIWSDIFDINSKNIENYYGKFFDNLCDFMDFIDSSDYKSIYNEVVKYSSLSSSESTKIIDPESLKKDIGQILFRLIIVLSYVKIDDITNYTDYAGNGFRDFTSIIELFKDIDIDYFSKLLADNKSSIIEYFNAISS